MVGAVTTVRPALLPDLPGVYRVCLETGDSGADATGQYRNPDLLGHVYAGPYLVGQPDYAFVAWDEAGVAGYVFAAEDTRAFEGWAEREWWPFLRERFPLVETDGTEAPHDAELVRLVHTPPLAAEAVVADYPAHLHIDLLPRAQGQGLGRVLIELVVDRLRERGICGVHLVVSAVNPRAIAFYRHLGFDTLSEDPEDVVMGKRLA